MLNDGNDEDGDQLLVNLLLDCVQVQLRVVAVHIAQGRDEYRCNLFTIIFSVFII